MRTIQKPAIRIAAFAQSLQQLGWTIGRNVRLDVRSGAVDADQIRKLASVQRASSTAGDPRCPDCFSADGGLIFYGPDTADQWRVAGGYVDRILKGEKPADLPVQAPTKYKLVINQKTSKALGLDILPGLIAASDEVIE